MMSSPAGASQTRIFSDSQLSQFGDDGFLFLPSMFSGRRLRRLIKWVDELERYPEEPGKTMFYYEDSVTDPSRRVLSRIEYFADYHAELGSLLRGPELVDPVSELFGAPAVLFKEKVNFKMPNGQGFQPHQDVQAGWDDYGSIHITALIAIDAATERNGCLEVAAGHHKRGLIGDMWKPLSDVQLAGVEFERYPTRPGDALFFDSYAPHKSAPNLSKSRRRILYVTYGLAADGNSRERYFAEKRRNYPPDIEREPGREYSYKV